MIKENQYYIIKPYKNRHKYELYIHNSELRAALNEHPIQVISEDLTGIVSFDKNIRFRSMVYGKIIEKIVSAFQSTSEQKEYAKNVHTYFEEKLAKIPQHIDLTKDAVRTGYYEHILKDL